jgi:hypothetical protein
MRSALADPIQDQAKLRELLPIAERVFALHEAGANYDKELRAISRLLARVVDRIDVMAGFGSGDSEHFARRLMTDWSSVPRELSEAEMLELVEALCSASGAPSAQEYWIRCLEANTGDDRISDLIFWPNEYFGSGTVATNLSPSAILSIALRRSASLPSDA